MIPLVRRLALVASVVATAAGSHPARACSVCGCGDPILSATDPAAIAGRLRLQLDTEYLRVDAGTEGQPGRTDRLTQWSYRVNGVYRPFENLAFTATLPIVSKDIRTFGGGASAVASSLTGLGDVELAGRYAVWSSTNLGVGRLQEIAVTAGTSIPTGPHDARAADGTLIDPHGQLGTGGWGPFAGLNYVLSQGRWLGFAAMSARLRTEGRYFDGSRYTYGNALLWSVHGQVRPVPRVALDLGVDGRTAAADRATLADGTVEAAVENTGGTVVAAAPGVYFRAVGGLWVFLRGQIPVVKRLSGEQDVLPSFTTGVQLQVF